MKTIKILILAIAPLCTMTACVSEGDDASTAQSEQALTGGTCVVLRPIGWSVSGVHCQEASSPPSMLNLSPGQSASFHSGAIRGIQGSGTLTVECDVNGDGAWHVVSETCQAGIPI